MRAMICRMGAVFLGVSSAWAATPVDAQSFVDLVAPATDVCVPAAFGNAPGLAFEYQVSSAFGSFEPVSGSCLRGWGLPGYGSLASAFWSPGVNSSSASTDVSQIVARATTPTEFVSLHSIDVARWSLAGSYPEVLGVRVYDLFGSELFSSTRAVGPLRADGRFDLQTFAPDVGAVGGLIVQFGEDPWWIAANNLRFGLGVDLSTPVPEPGVAPLLVLGAVGLVTLRHRRSRRPE